MDGQLTIIVRDKAIPLFYLHKWLVRGAGKTARQDQGHVVIVQIGTQQVGFVVDNLIGQEEVVIKPWTTCCKVPRHGRRHDYQRRRHRPHSGCAQPAQGLCPSPLSARLKELKE